MLKAMLRRKAIPMLMGLALAGGTFTLAGRPAQAQVQPIRLDAFSPVAQQALRLMLSGLPTYGQQLVLNAIRALGPQRAEAQLSQLMAMPPPSLQAFGRVLMQILQVLPPQYHQAFVDGLFHVSPAEGQFATQVVYQIVWGRNAIGGQAAMSQNVIGPQAAETQNAMLDQILASQQRIWEMNQRLAQQMHDTTMRVGEGWIRTLGPDPYPRGYPYP